MLRALNRIGEDKSAQQWIRERKAPIFFVGVDDSAYTCLAADAKAAKWGFKHDLATSLAADVAAESDPKKKEQLQRGVDALRQAAAGRLDP